jgi:hypothetical protein
MCARQYLLIFLLCTIISCNSEKDDHSAQYGIFSFSNQDSNVFGTTSSLSNGILGTSKKIKPDEEGIFTNKDNFYYAIDDKTGNFIKFKVEENSLKSEKAIPFKSKVSWRPVASWFSWANDTTLFLGNSMSGKQFVYSTIDVKNMQIISSGNLDIPLPKKDFNYGGVMGRLVGNKLYVAYMLYQYEDKQALPGDTIYLATIDYPLMKTASITKDSRSTFPGGYILFWQVSLELDGDLYFIAQPGSRLRRHPKYNSAVYRIRKGDNKLDPEYFFPLSDNVTQEAYGLYDLGDGKALTKVADKSKVNQFSDYYESNVVSYYLLDLKTKASTKMDLPDDRLDFHKNVISKDGKAYIGIYSPDGTSTVWNYDLTSGKSEKGLKIKGQILMMDELK